MSNSGFAGGVIRVVIADNEPVMVRAVSMVVDQSAGLEIVAETHTAEAALNAVRTLSPHVLLHELSFGRGSGIDLVRDVVATGSSTACLAFTRLAAPMYAEHYLRAGGRGYIPKTDPIESILRGIRTVVDGGLFVSESEAGALLGRLVNPSASPVASALERLSTSEFQVLQLIAQGMANRDISETLHRSVKTVETYRSRMKRKLGLTNGVELAQYAVLHLADPGLGGDADRLADLGNLSYESLRLPAGR